MFYPLDGFEGVRPLADRWEVVRDELDGLSQNAFMKWPETNIYKGKWTVFPLFKIGVKVPQNCILCPQTAQMLNNIPGMINAGFSSLAPGTYIGPHRGYTNEVLRCHVGLKPPRTAPFAWGRKSAHGMLDPALSSMTRLNMKRGTEGPLHELFFYLISSVTPIRTSRFRRLFIDTELRTLLS
jgi:hypothetical protein